MRKPLIAGNWKMYKTINEAIALATQLKRELLDLKGVDIALCPPFTNLSSVYEIIMETNIKLGAQDVFWKEEGAYTGEVSALMLKDCGCEFIIIGHSERRKYFFENDENINRKIKASLGVGLTPIVCVGETLQEREKKRTVAVVESQLKGCFGGLKNEDMHKVVIAYEPVWAIGTGRTATGAQAEEVQKFIRKWIEDNFTHSIAQDARILYGGSVKPSNIRELMQEEDIDGALVGGASLEVSSFADIVKNAIVGG